MLHNKFRKIALSLKKDEWIDFIDSNNFFNDISNEKELKILNNILIASQDKKLIESVKEEDSNDLDFEIGHYTIEELLNIFS